MQLKQRVSWAVLRRTLATLGQQLDLLLALVLLVAISNVTYVLSSPPVIWGFSFLDHSWAVDFVVKAQQQVWLGDKVTFTYGPLSQLAFSAVAIPIGGSLGAYFRSWYLVPFWSGIVFTFLTGRILLSGHSPWKRCFYLLALVGFWNALDLRFGYDVVAFAAALAYFDRVQRVKSVLPWASVGVSLLLVAGFLISADTGMYSLAAFIVAGSSHLLIHRSDRATRLALIRAAALAALMFAGLVLLTAVAMPNAGLGFWINSLEVVSQYRWSMAASMEKPIKWRLITAATSLLLVLLIGCRWRDPLGRSLVRRPAFFPAAIAFSFLTLQSAIIRSDWGHVAIALLPSFALAGAVLMGAESQASGNWRGDLPVVLALGITAVFSGPIAPLAPNNVVAGLRLSAVTKSQTCPDRMFYLDEACLPGSDYKPLRAVSEFLLKHTSPADTIAIFPFENIYGDIARRRVAGGVLQNYQIAGERLTRRQLDGLDRDHPQIAIFSADGLGTFGLDGVPNFTRTPEVWFYLQSRFVKSTELTPGIVALARDQTRLARWHQETRFAGPPFESEIRLKQPITVPLSGWYPESDFVKLLLRVDYPVWWRLWKPCFLTVKIQHADYSEKVLRAVLQPSKLSELWIYPWDDAHLLNYFAEDERIWRKGRPRSPVTELELTFQRMDDFSVVPSKIKIQAIEAVRLRLN